MKQVTVHVAKTTLSKLIDAVLAGEAVIIARENKPIVRLVATRQSRFRIGLLEGQVSGPGPDFFTPMDADEVALWERQ